MNPIPYVIAVALVLAASPVQAKSNLPDLKGKWRCTPAPMLIRGDWTTLTYSIDISEQRDALFKGTFHWTLPEKTDVKGERVTGAKAFEGTWTALGVVDWDGKTVEIVSYKGLQRHVGTLVDADTIRFVHSKVGDDAWVSRSTCKRQG
jgi:hypothetical protein